MIGLIVNEILYKNPNSNFVQSLNHYVTDFDSSINNLALSLNEIKTS